MTYLVLAMVFIVMLYGFAYVAFEPQGNAPASCAETRLDAFYQRLPEC